MTTKYKFWPILRSAGTCRRSSSNKPRSANQASDSSRPRYALAADYLLNRLGRDYAHEVTAEVQIGEDAEFPRTMPEVVTPGYQIRRILCTFTGWLKDYAGYDEGRLRVGFDDLHSALTTRLVFR